MRIASILDLVTDVLLKVRRYIILPSSFFREFLCFLLLTASTFAGGICKFEVLVFRKKDDRFLLVFSRGGGGGGGGGDNDCADEVDVITFISEPTEEDDS